MKSTSMKSTARLAVALHAVSTSPPMPDFERYVEAVETLRPSFLRTNPPGPRLGEAFDVSGFRRAPRVDPTIRATDLVAALSSFTDDYGARPPRELFAVPVAESILDALRRERCLTVAEQLDLALGCAPGGSYDAFLGLHTATRVLARGRDTRLSPSFSIALEERLERGRAIAPFDPRDARGGDPLGDTYHFWANVCGGIYAVSPGVSRAQRSFVAGMLYAGPWLMRGVREATFGSPLFYGDHARVDRLGLSLGMALGRRA